MKKIITTFLFLSLLPLAIDAREPLRADETIQVESGKIINTGILTDDNGIVFLEFLKGSFVNYQKDQQPFSGEILPPAIIDKPLKFPRYRMREILTMELLTDNVETVSFVDRYSLMHPKEYLRKTLQNPDGLTHGQGIKFLTRIYAKDKIGLPALWILQTEKNNDQTQTVAKKYWKRIGGRLVESEENGVKVFSAILNQTGVYGLFDENPYAYYSPNTPLETVEKVEVSPYPSVLPQTQTSAINTTKNTTEDTSYDNDQQFKDDNFYIDGNNNVQLIPAVEDTKTETVIDTRIIPAVDNFEEPIIPAVDNKVPSVDDFQDLQSNDPNIQTLPVTGKDSADLPNSGFPIILFLAFLILGGSFYLAFKKQY